MEPSKHTSSKFYEDHFDPMYHLSFMKNFLTQDDPSGGVELGEVALVHELMKTGENKGKDLLEVGCGPSILFSIIPSQYYENVYLADYLQRNVDIIQTWVDDKPGQVDFQHFFDLVGNQMGKGSTWPDGPAEHRQKIRGVFQCDIHLPEVLPSDVKPRTFDCIIAAFVLDAACATGDEFNNAVLHIASLLKPGGIFITYLPFECTFYKLDKKFPEFFITNESLSQALSKANLHIIYKQCKKSLMDESYSDLTSFGLYVAKKY